MVKEMHFAMQPFAQALLYAPVHSSGTFVDVDRLFFSKYCSKPGMKRLSSAVGQMQNAGQQTDDARELSMCQQARL